MASQYGPWIELRFMRERSKIRSMDLADAAGISHSHLSNLESGKRWPSRATTVALAEALGILPSMIERRIEGEVSCPAVN